MLWVGSRAPETRSPSWEEPPPPRASSSEGSLCLFSIPLFWNDGSLLSGGKGERGEERNRGWRGRMRQWGGMGVSYIYSSGCFSVITAHHGGKTNTCTRLQLICPFSPSLPYWCEQHWLQRSAGVTLAGAQPGGGVPSFAILLTFTLQFQLFKAACTSAACQPASPSCEKWVMEFKGARSLVTAAFGCFSGCHTDASAHARLCVSVCVCARVCVRAQYPAGCFWNFSESESHSSSLWMCVRLSVGLLCKLPPIFSHGET